MTTSPALEKSPELRVPRNAHEDPTDARRRVLWLSTLAFTLLFNVWLMLGVLSIPIRKELGLSDAQLEWLIAVAILAGSVFRLNFGIWADVYLLALTVWSLAWLHLAVTRLHTAKFPVEIEGRLSAQYTTASPL